MKIAKSLIIISIIVAMLPMTVKAEAGDFYYGDSTNLTRIKKAEVKDKKDLLKENINNLYFQVNDNIIVNYKDFMSKIINSWSTGNSIGNAYTSSVNDVGVHASDEIRSKAADADANDSDTSDDFDVLDIF
ncbi:hypothetical protein [Clostridium kluyveri]|uniref:hypothetical protein n=1 Tax=Clostridium kluyveri TaxID=1534 RepID=UPI0022477C2B|nr:hypothetical protein [Clostridium kluyveri]UZQ49413.1 hypothetical protein OP486_15845 [Clostridium kluyveri]